MLDFISRHRNNPFFCYYPMILTHSPFVPTPDSKNQQNENEKENFADMIAYMDKIVGKIEAHLDKLGLLDNTLIMFTGDNGTNRQIVSNTSSGKIQGDKGHMTNAGMHVPFIVNWKGVAPEGKVCVDLIDFSDFMPTLVEATDAKLPLNRVIDGRSFIPQLKGQKGNPREWIFCFYWGGGRTKEGTREFAMNKRWKLYNDGAMFDIQKDPLEENPLGNFNEEMLKAKEILKRAIEKVTSK
jgi:arylsulfatase A